MHPDPGNYAGEIQFDLYVFGAETDADSSIQVKLDSGFPDLGWHVKLESSGAATAVDILMTAGGNPTPTADWQEYSFELDTEFAGLDLSDLTLVLFFPDGENANGAVARIDNIRLVPPQQRALSMKERRQ